MKSTAVIVCCMLLSAAFCALPAVARDLKGLDKLEDLVLKKKVVVVPSPPPPSPPPPVVIEKDPKKLEALLALLKDKVLSKKDLALSPDVDLTELLKEVAATPDTPAMAISGVGK